MKRICLVLNLSPSHHHILHFPLERRAGVSVESPAGHGWMYLWKSPKRTTPSINQVSEVPRTKMPNCSPSSHCHRASHESRCLASLRTVGGTAWVPPAAFLPAHLLVWAHFRTGAQAFWNLYYLTHQSNQRSSVSNTSVSWSRRLSLPSKAASSVKRCSLRFQDTGDAMIHRLSKTWVFDCHLYKLL